MLKCLFIYLLFVIIPNNCICQNRLDIATGLKIHTNTISINNAIQNIMGKEMIFAIKGNTDFYFTVLSLDPDIRLKTTISRIQFETESMGMKSYFDSRNMDDIETPIGSLVSKTIDNPFDLHFTTNGVLVSNSNDLPNADPLNNLISNFKNIFSELFLLIPGTPHIGFSWVEEINEIEGESKKMEYIVAEVSNSFVIIKFNGSSKNRNTTIVQQNKSIVTSTNVIKGEMTLGFGGLIKEKRTEINSTGVIEFMGQSATFSLTQSILTTNTF